MEPVKVAIIYYSATGTVHALARAAAEGADKAGAHVRLHKIDTTGALWCRGGLAGKVYSAFTASSTAHGGQELTLLALGNTFYHWGGIIVPPGYSDPIQLQSGNPYGTSHVAGDGLPGDVALEAARYQARRAVDTAASLKAGGWL